MLVRNQFFIDHTIEIIHYYITTLQVYPTIINQVIWGRWGPNKIFQDANQLLTTTQLYLCHHSYYRIDWSTVRDINHTASHRFSTVTRSLKLEIHCMSMSTTLFSSAGRSEPVRYSRLGIHVFNAYIIYRYEPKQLRFLQGFVVYLFFF